MSVPDETRDRPLGMPREQAEELIDLAMDCQFVAPPGTPCPYGCTERCRVNELAGDCVFGYQPSRGLLAAWVRRGWRWLRGGARAPGSSAGDG